MDIWDHTQLRPERERFRRHLDFSRLGQPRDAFALEVGERWLQQSHGLEIARQCRLTMADYLSGADALPPAVTKQIEKDLKRTSADSLTQPTLKTFIGGMPKEDTTESIRRVLHALAARNRRIGYCQGLDLLVLFLMAFHPAHDPKLAAAASGEAVSGSGALDAVQPVRVTSPDGQQLFETVGANADPQEQLQSQERQLEVASAEAGAQVEAEAASEQPAAASSTAAGAEQPQETWAGAITSQHEGEVEEQENFHVVDGEERVFWTLCGVIERLLPEDFYDPPPAMLHGFVVEQRLLVFVAGKVFPKLLAFVGEEAFGQTLELLSHKWLMTLFLDCAPLKVTCMIWQSFFTREGLDGVLSAVLTVLETCNKPVFQKGKDFFLVCLMDHTRSMTSRLMMSGLQQPKFRPDPAQVARARQRIRIDLATRWNEGQQLHEINRSTAVSLQELEKLQSVFQNIYEKRQQGIPRKFFLSLVLDSAPHLEPGLVGRIFTIFDKDKRDTLNFCELVSAISLLSSRAPPDEKIRLAFDLFDSKSRGFLERNEIESLALTWHGMVRQYLRPNDQGSPMAAAAVPQQVDVPEHHLPVSAAAAEPESLTLDGVEAGAEAEAKAVEDHNLEHPISDQLTLEDLLPLRANYDWPSFKAEMPVSRLSELLLPANGHPRINLIQFRKAVVANPLLLSMVVNVLQVDNLLDNAAQHRDTHNSNATRCVIS